MTRILFYLDGFPHDPWRNAILSHDKAIDFRSHPDWGSPEDGPAYAVVWEPKHGLIEKYPNIQAVFSLGAGIDHILDDTSIPEELPIIRMGDDGLVEGMLEYVVMNVLMHHRQMPAFLNDQKNRVWQRRFAKPASALTVGIMGYGKLGHAATQAFIPFGYRLQAWSNSKKPAEEHVKHFSGKDALADFLSSTDILVGLLPETEDTKGLLSAEKLTMLPAGASVINAGRGSLIDLEALHVALESGHIASASLDVVPEEPLPADHSIWQAKNIIITPHIAAITRTETAAKYILDNIKRIEAGQTPENMLNRKLGY